MPKIKNVPDPRIERRLRVLMRNNPELNTQEALASKSGVGQRTVGRILNSEVSSSLNTYKKLCAAFGVPPDSLTSESSFLDNENDSDFHENIIESYSVAVVDENEILSWTRGGKKLDDVSHTQSREYLMTDIKTEKPSHFIRVKDDSMLNELPLGCTAHIDVHLKPERSDLVEAKLKNNTIVFRKYKPLTSGGFELVSNNNIFDTISSEDVEQIIGVVVEWRVKLK